MNAPSDAPRREVCLLPVAPGTTDALPAWAAGGLLVGSAQKACACCGREFSGRLSIETAIRLTRTDRAVSTFVGLCKQCAGQYHQAGAPRAAVMRAMHSRLPEVLRDV